MNTLVLEFKKFIRSRIFVVILGVMLVLLASLFYKNYLNYQQIDADKKHELLLIKKEIGDILYPAGGKSPCIYSGDKEKMDLLKKSLEISEKTLKLKHSGDDRGYMESAILMYEKIIDFLSEQSSGKVLEIGVGTGCIIHTLALECPDFSYQGVDVSEGALEIAKKNQERYQLENVSLYRSDVFQEVSSQKFVCIISNPPYIDVSEKNVMDESVLRFEPEVALFAEDEGLAIYRKIAENLEIYLLEEGQAFFEIGFQQGKAVQQLFEQYCKNREVSIHKDLSGNDRMIIVGRRK